MDGVEEEFLECLRLLRENKVATMISKLDQLDKKKWLAVFQKRTNDNNTLLTEACLSDDDVCLRVLNYLVESYKRNGAGIVMKFVYNYLSYIYM